MARVSAAEMSRKLTRVLPMIQPEVAKIIQRSPELIREKTQEFKRGEMPDGSRIGYYSNSPLGRAYRSYKQSLNPMASGTVDLILTGQFTRGLFVESKGNSRFLFDSNDDKTPDLVEEYGQDIMGINPDAFYNLQRDRFRFDLIKFIKREIGV